MIFDKFQIIFKVFLLNYLKLHIFNDILILEQIGTGDNMSKKSFFQTLYSYDKSSKKYLIEVSLDDYNDIYDDWDPAPFKKRDIEDEFNEFIFSASEDIPLNHNIAILLYLPSSKKDTKKESVLIAAYQNYYAYIIDRTSRLVKSINKKIIFNLLFSFTLLFIGYFSDTYAENIFMNVFKEGIFVGGWVFLWDFFTDLFFKKREMKHEAKLYKRLLNADIRFIYTE